MSESKEKIFYSFVHRNGYEGDCPAYFKNEDYSWIPLLEKSFPIIQKELQQLMNGNDLLKPYRNGKLVNDKRAWRTLAFKAWGVHYHSKLKQIPMTAGIFAQLPCNVSLSFNLLEPGADIEPHHGDTSASMRGHLGMVIPTSLPDVGFRVNEEERPWEEGKVLLFSDAHRHAAWNHSNEERIILLFDVIRPEFIGKKRVICSRVLSSLFLQRIAAKMPVLAKFPRIVQAALYFSVGATFYWLVPVRNFFSKIFN